MCSVYILSLCNGNYYIGSTRNLEQRLIDHQLGKSGYTHKYLPVKLVFQQSCDNYSQAKKLENHIKRFKSKVMVEKLINKIISLPQW